MRRARLIREGDYLAEVWVELLEVEGEWSPYLSVEDAYKLDDVRAALREGNLAAAAKLGKVYTMTLIDV